VFDNASVYITSKIDEWFLEINKDGYSYLYHKNTKKNKNSFHKQKIKFLNINNVPDYKAIFDIIQQHDTYVLKYKGYNDRIVALLNKVKECPQT
jgi:hypothetical protein